MPQTPSSALLKVQGSSKLAFGATTAALVTLASGGTAVLVSHVAHGVTSPTALPGGGLPPDVAGAAEGLVVGHPAGASPVAHPADATERALHKALTARPRTPRRTLTAPLVPLTPPAPPVVPTVPVVTPPITVPVDQPVTQPDEEPTPASRELSTHGRAKKRSNEGAPAHHSRGRHAHHRSAGKGKHAR